MENCALDNNVVGKKGKSWSFLCTVHCWVTELCLPSWLPRYGRCQTARSLHQLTPGSMHFPPGCSQANVHYFCMEGSDMKIHSDHFLFLLVTVTELMEDSNCCMEFKQELHLEAFNKEVQVKYDWPVSTCDRTTASPHLYFNDTMGDIHSLSRRSECNIFQRYLFHLCCPSLSRGNESGNYHQLPGSTINSKGENPIKSSLWYSRHI